MQWHLLWGDSGDQRRFSLVADLVKRPIAMGVDCIIYPSIMNKALLVKRHWKFMHSRTYFWIKVIVAKYGSEKKKLEEVDGVMNKQGLQFFYKSTPF